jgi:hypothetical protein
MRSPFLDDLPEDRLVHDRMTLGGTITGASPRAAGSPLSSRSPWSQTRSPFVRPAPARRARSWDGGDVDAQALPDYEGESQDAGDAEVSPEGGLAPRAVVFHPTFGEGTVVSMSGDGRDAIVQVRFKGGGERRIVARFLTLA